MRNKIFATIIINIIIILALVACGEIIDVNDKTLFNAYGIRGEFYYVRGNVVYIKGIGDENWVVPNNIDFINLKIKNENNGQYMTIIMLSETYRNGEIGVGSSVTVYWLKNSPIFELEIPTYIASIVAVDGREFDHENELLLWQLFNMTERVSSKWPDEVVRGAVFPEVFEKFKFETHPLPIVAYGRKLEEPAIVMNDGTIMVPLQSSIASTPDDRVATHINIGSDYFNDGTLTIVVTDGSISGIRVIAVGYKYVINAHGVYLCTPPIIIEGIVYVPLLSFFRDMRPMINSYAKVFSDRLEIIWSE